METSIVIVNHNTKALLEKCLRSLVGYIKKIHYEIIVVDNASTDGSLAFLYNFKKLAKVPVKIIECKQNYGFSKGNNLGIKRSNGKYVLLLNSDTEFKNDVLFSMLEWVKKRPRCGIASCRLVYPDGSTQSAGGYFPTLVKVFTWMTIQDLPIVDRIIKPFHPGKEKLSGESVKIFENNLQLDWVTGAFFLVRRGVFESVGYLDEDYFMYTEEVDFCYRAKEAGWRVCYNPNLNIVHHKGASATSEFSVLQEYKGVKLFYQKHFPSWQFTPLRVLLKLGALLRMVVLGVTEGVSSAKIYAKAFRIA